MSRLEEINFELEMLEKSIALVQEELRKHHERVQKSFLGKMCRFFTAPYRMFKEQWQKGNFFGVIGTGILCLLATITLVGPLFGFIGAVKRARDDDKRIVIENRQNALLARKSELEAEKQIIVENDRVADISKQEKQNLAQKHFQENYKEEKMKEMENEMVFTKTYR